MRKVNAKGKYTKRDGCFFFHRWRKLKDNGFTVYFECSRCGARKFFQRRGGYQPVDHAWLTFTKKAL